MDNNKVIKSSGNVFANIGCENPEEMFDIMYVNESQYCNIENMIILNL